MFSQVFEIKPNEKEKLRRLLRHILAIYFTAIFKDALHFLASATNTWINS